MQSNPIIEQQIILDNQRRVSNTFRYPFNIVCVFLDSDNNDFPIIKEVKDYCNNNNLIFLARQYDIDKYTDDMNIKRLPAFHIYYKKYIDQTEYYDTNPIHKIQVSVWAYQDEMLSKERARLRRKELWDNTLSKFKSMLSLENFKQKPHLDLDSSLCHSRDEKNKEKN